MLLFLRAYLSCAIRGRLYESATAAPVAGMTVKRKDLSLKEVSTKHDGFFGEQFVKS